MAGSRAGKQAIKKNIVRIVCLILAAAMVASTFLYLVYYLLQ